jgi:hypothetical protein
MVGYGGKVTVGSPGVVGVVDDAAIILAAGAFEVVSVFGSVVSAAALCVSVFSACLTSICSAVTVSAAGVAVCSVGVLDDFSLFSAVGVVSVTGAVVPEPVWACSVGAGFSVVGSVGVSVGVVPVPEELPLVTVVPEPPDALTDDVGPPAEVVVVVVCEPGGVVVVVDVPDSVPVVAPEVPEVPEVVVPEELPLVEPAFAPVSEFAVGSEELPSSVVAEATPWPVATAIPSPTATARPLARLARVGRFACLPRLAADMSCSRLPRVTDSWDPEAGA